jgi:hypothetical protein
MTRPGRSVRRSTLGVVGAVVLGVLLAGGLEAAAMEEGRLGAPTGSAGRHGAVGGSGLCSIDSGATCIESLVGSAWQVRPVSAWCTQNTSGTSVPGPNGTTVGTTSSTYCDPSVGYITFNMSVNGSLNGVLSASGPFAVWVVPAADDCATIYYSIANIPVPCPPPYGSFPLYTWNGSAPSAGSVDLAAGDGGPNPLSPSYWEILLVDTGSATEPISVTASVTLAPA